MEKRDRYKEQAKSLAISEGVEASPEQAALWEKYKRVRNSINNRMKHAGGGQV